MNRRVVVTGMGAVTPLGNDVETTWANMIAGQSGIGPITLFDTTNYVAKIAGEVKGFDARGYVDAKELRRLDRNVQFAVVAAVEALRDSGLTIDERNRDDVGIVVGSAIGGIRTLLDAQKTLDERGPTKVNAHFVQNLIPDTASAQIAITTGARGPNMAVVSACATGGHSIGEAAEIIRRGDAPAIIAGGTESNIVPLVIAGFTVMRVLAIGNGDPTKAIRPFDSTRQGFVLGEGAGILILEDLDHALARGARIRGELIGYGSSNDGYHLAAPAESGEGAVRAMRMAIRKAGISPEDVDYINAHGTGTGLNDKFETTAIKTVFGEHARRLAISSTKSMTGHMMGAAGAVEGIACILACERGVIPPTINLETPDPDCDLDYVPMVCRHANVRVAMSNSIGLGGHNSTLVFRKYE